MLLLDYNTYLIIRRKRFQSFSTAPKNTNYSCCSNFNIPSILSIVKLALPVHIQTLIHYSNMHRTTPKQHQSADTQQPPCLPTPTNYLTIIINLFTLLSPFQAIKYYNKNKNVKFKSCPFTRKTTPSNCHSLKNCGCNLAAVSKLSDSTSSYACTLLKLTFLFLTHWSSSRSCQPTSTQICCKLTLAVQKQAWKESLSSYVTEWLFYKT